MNIPKDYLFTEDHIWVKKVDDQVKLGITAHLQSEIGDVLLVELPKTGKNVKKGENFALIETAKAVIDVKSPLSGIITEVNSALEEEPDPIKEDPYGKGWMVALKIDPHEGHDHLMDAARYKEYLEKRH